MQTRELSLFLREIEEIYSWIIFTHELALGSDRVKIAAAKALSEGSGATDIDRKRFEDLLKNPHTVTAQHRRYRSLNHRIFLTYIVDAFLCYIADLLKVVHFKIPEIIGTNEKISYADVISFTNYSDLTAHLIEKRVTNLTFLSFRELDRELREKLSFALAPKTTTLIRLNKLIEIRNLFVHNRGIVNSRYCQRTTDTKTKIGEKVILPNAVRASQHIIAVSYDIDRRAISKFKLSEADGVETSAPPLALLGTLPLGRVPS